MLSCFFFVFFVNDRGAGSACGTRSLSLVYFSLIRYRFSITSSAWRGQMMLHLTAKRGLLKAQKRESCIVVCRG